MEQQPTPKPTLHEIAAMPFSQTAYAIRKFYDPNFGLMGPMDGGTTEFSVKIHWSYSCDETDHFTVRADSLAEAEEKAKLIWEDDLAKGDYPEINDIEIREVK